MMAPLDQDRYPIYTESNPPPSLREASDLRIRDGDNYPGNDDGDDGKHHHHHGDDNSDDNTPSTVVAAPVSTMGQVTSMTSLVSSERSI